MIDFASVLTGFAIGLFIGASCGLLNIVIRSIYRWFMG